jgi:hypothetical protein
MLTVKRIAGRKKTARRRHAENDEGVDITPTTSFTVTKV